MNCGGLHRGLRTALGVQQVLLGAPVAHIEREGVVDVLEGERELVDVPTLPVNRQRPLLEVDVCQAKAPEVFLRSPNQTRSSSAT